MKNKVKNRTFLIVGIIIGILISATGVYAVDTIIIDSKNVSYDNSKSNGSYKDVKESIDELYQRTGVLSTKWVDPTLNGADPVLKEDLIPIDIEDDGTVYYASLYTEWYNYKEKRWANAVKLVGNPSKKYNTGDKIEEKDIESYFVWIPRYKYKLWNVDNYKLYSLSNLEDTNTPSSEGKQSLYKFNNESIIIDVVFESKSTNKSTGSTNGTYLTHPAFTLNGKELNGLWVGKFETGYNQNGENGNPIDSSSWNKEGAQATLENPASNRIIIKPNVYSWRNISVKTAFLTSLNYNKDLVSHMMKNTEWGAVAYLSHSSYGIGTEVRINNNSDFKTGYSAAANTNQNKFTGTYGVEDDVTKAYNTATGYLASTTGNIYGVYDMSGGAWEYVAAYMSGQTGSSGFSTTTLTQYKAYFDVYDANSTTTSYSNRILGDATGEMGPFYLYYNGDGSRYHNSWYFDQAEFIASDAPWFNRSGAYDRGLLASQFFFRRYHGAAGASTGFRLVLSPSN